MKLWHLLFAVFGASLAFAVARDPVGRVGLVVFFTMIGLIVLGTSSVVMLFRTIGLIGMAQTVGDHLEALAATVGVLFFGTAGMLAVLWCGLGMMIQAAG